MGQGQSGEAVPRTHEELVKELANRFATKCFTPLELYSLKDNFKALADATEDAQHVIHEHGTDGDEDENAPAVEPRKPQVVRYLKEDTVARFLAIPDILGASPVVFQMLTYMGAFPFLNDAPAVLGLEQLVMVVTLLTERYKRVLSHGASDRRTLLFRSLAVHDRKLFAEDRKESVTEDPAQPAPTSSAQGFAVDAPTEDDEDLEEDGLGPGADDDDLVLAAFEALDYTNPLPKEKKAEGGRKTAAETAATLHGARIPADNFRKLLMLLLLVAPLGPQEPLSLYVDRFTGDALDNLRAAAQCVLTTFLDVETSPGIKFSHFEAIIPVCFPYIFNGFNGLFERFLFSKNLDLSRTKPGAGDDTAADTPGSAENGSPRKRTSSAIAGISSKDALPPPPPLLLQESDNTIMNLNLLSQLSFFIPGSSLFHSLRLLYSGDNDGFSMGSFETKVFNWRAPTILLVKGSRMSDSPRGGQEATFSAALPPRRFPHGDGNLDGSGSSGDNDDDEEPLIFGAYVSQPWQMTHRECFGNSDMLLFQLSPVHDVFGASTINQDYAAFVKPSAANQHAGGIGFGCPSPQGTAVKASLKQQSQSMEGILPLGPLSLMIDANLEFGVMTHDRGHRGSASTSMGSSYNSYSSGSGGGGGAFHSSVARTFSFQERFSIEALEVWGCGGHAEAQAQADRWAWEAREAEARRRINLGTGDVEADRALLEMAGLIGANRSGGSMV